MKITVIRAAFYDGAMREPGTVLEVPDGFKASWASSEEGVKAPAKPAKQEPQALSKAGKDAPQSFIEAHAKK